MSRQFISFVLMDFRAVFEEYKLKNLNRRYLPPEQFDEQITEFGLKGLEIGQSAEERPIRVFRFGAGPTKILLWSQMHGNESTATRVFLDIFNFFINDREKQKELISNLSLYFIPMLNPDGADMHSRENAKGIDLNRDFVDTKSPEMKAFVEYVDKIDPDWAFNMHDQRNIFNVAGSNNPATISVLAPTYDEARSVNEVREDAMRIGAVICKELEPDLSGHLSRFTDEFYPLASGDNMQKRGVRTMTIESGGYPNDPMREVGRKATFVGLLAALKVLNEGSLAEYEPKSYLAIPEAEKKLCDVLLWNEEMTYAYAFVEDRKVVNGQLKVEFILDRQGEWKDAIGYREFKAIEPIQYKDGVRLNMDDIADVADLLYDRGLNAEKVRQSN